MNQKFKVNLTYAIVFTLVFTLLVPGLNVMAEEIDNSEENIDYDSYLVDDSMISKEEIHLFDDNSTDIHETDDSNLDQVIRPMFAPLVPIVISTVVRLVAKWVGKQAVKKVTKHAAKRAAERGISSNAFAKAMAYGTKYVDKESGAKILYHKSTKTALVLNKSGKTVVTSYKASKPKSKWKRQNW